MADTAKAAVTLDDGSTRELDIIEFDGQHWIVSDWLSLSRSDPTACAAGVTPRGRAPVSRH